jgi:hypothetical protein
MKRLMIGLMAAASLVACSRTTAPEAVVEEVMRASETGRCDTLADNFSASSRQMIGDKLKESCRQETEQRKGKPAQKTLKSLKVVDRKEEGDRATVRLEPEFSDGSRETAQSFVLVKEDGRWKIDLLATAAANGKSQGGGGGGSPMSPMPSGPPAAGPTAPPAAGPAAPAPEASNSEDQADVVENAN